MTDNPKATPGELPTVSGHYIFNGDLWRLCFGPGNDLVSFHRWPTVSFGITPSGGCIKPKDLPRGNWLPLTDAGEVGRLREENAAYRAQFTAIGQVPYLDRMRELAKRAEAAERERDVYRAIIEAATLESVDAVSAKSMREKFCERNDKLTAAEQRLAEVVGAVEAASVGCVVRPSDRGET